MNALRWILGSITILFGGGFVFLVIVGNAFRKSFGASEHGPFLIALPLVGLAMLLAAILFPSVKPLLHLAAIVTCVLLGVCLRQIFAHGAISLWFAVGYFGLWLTYYWLAAWRVAPEP